MISLTIITAALIIGTFGYFLASILIRLGFVTIFVMGVISVYFLIILMFIGKVGVIALLTFAIIFGIISMVCICGSFLEMVYKVL